MKIIPWAMVRRRNGSSLYEIVFDERVYAEWLGA